MDMHLREMKLKNCFTVLKTGIFRMLLGYATHYTALRYFAKLVTAAFGIERADNWEDTLEDFTVSLGQCKGYNLTPKQHAVVFHLEDYINDIINIV